MQVFNYKMNIMNLNTQQETASYSEKRVNYQRVEDYEIWVFLVCRH